MKSIDGLRDYHDKYQRLIVGPLEEVRGQDRHRLLTFFNDQIQDNIITNPINHRSVGYVDRRHTEEDLLLDNAITLSVHTEWKEMFGLNYQDIMALDFHHYGKLRKRFDERLVLIKQAKAEFDLKNQNKEQT